MGQGGATLQSIQEQRWGVSQGVKERWSRVGRVVGRCEKGGDWLAAGGEGYAWGGGGTLAIPPEMKAGAGPHLSFWIDLGDKTEIKHPD